MSDRVKKPKNYKRGRRLEFERICREERAAGETVVVVKPCQRSFPCVAYIMVLAGCEQPCENCAPNIPRMRELHGYEPVETSHGTFYKCDQLTPEQQQLVGHRIAQCDIRNWINTEED